MKYATEMMYIPVHLNVFKPLYLACPVEFRRETPINIELANTSLSPNPNFPVQ